MDASQIGEKLRAAREAKGLSQEEAARRIGTSWASVSRWELGKQRIRGESLVRAAEAYGVTVESLTGGRERSSANTPRTAEQMLRYRVAESFRLPPSIEATLRRFEADALDAGVPLDQIEQVVAAVRGPIENAVKHYGGTEIPDDGEDLADLVRNITEELHAFLEAAHRLATGGVGRGPVGAPKKKR